MGLFNRRSPNFTASSATILLTIMAHVTSPAASGRMHILIEYCIQVHQAGPADKESNNRQRFDERSQLMNDTQNVCRDL